MFHDGYIRILFFKQGMNRSAMTNHQKSTHTLLKILDFEKKNVQNSILLEAQPQAQLVLNLFLIFDQF